jgi:hypothetical protein
VLISVYANLYVLVGLSLPGRSCNVPWTKYNSVGDPDPQKTHVLGPF